MTIRLLIADDHELVREGLRAILEPTRIEVVGEAATCQEAMRLAATQEPDVMLLDISMPGGDGFDVLRHVRGKMSLPVLIYSMHDRDHHIRRARQLGANGYLTKRACGEELIRAIEAVSRGKSYWDDAFADVPAEQPTQF